MELILSKIAGFIMAHLTTILGVVGIGGLLGLILRKFFTVARLEIWGKAFYDFGYGVGRVITLGLSVWKYTKPVWNKVLEPLVITVFKTVFMPFFTGLFAGMESDNPSLKDD